MRREFSAGGVLVRRLDGRWVLAALRPAGKRPGIWALPKGQIEEGDSGEATALREVAEETGAHGRSLGKLGDVRYWFNWEGERVFKVVSFFLLRYRSGSLDDYQRAEVDGAEWIPLADAPRLLAYRGEKDMAKLALSKLADSG
jgi:8-oxo-dGTP pyrophosphatase MutT (NUDIX family)